jgi:hypothetical protein
VYTWFYWINPCNVPDVTETSAFLVSQMKRYDDVYMVTTNAPPTMLVRPVAELQQILMDTQGVPVPICMQTAKDEAVNYMGTVIRAFQAYAAQETDETIRGLLDESTTHFINFTTELDAVEKCAPFCAPWD